VIQTLRSIVIPASEDTDLISLHLVNEPMLLIDPPGPAAAEFMLKGFGFA